MCDRKSSRRHGKRESSSSSRSADGTAPEVAIVVPDGKESAAWVPCGPRSYRTLVTSKVVTPLEPLVPTDGGRGGSLEVEAERSQSPSGPSGPVWSQSPSGLSEPVQTSNHHQQQQQLLPNVLVNFGLLAFSHAIVETAALWRIGRKSHEFIRVGLF